MVTKERNAALKIVMLVASALTLHPQQALAQTAGRPLADVVGKTLCTYSKTAKRQAANLAQTLQRASSAAKQSRQAQQLAALALAKLPDYKEAAATLLIYATHKIQDAQASIENWTGENTKLVGQAMYSSGRIDELMLLLEGHREDGANGQDKTCLGAAAGGNTVNEFVKTECDTESGHNIEADNSNIGQAATTLSQESTDPEASGGASCKITANLATDYDSHANELPLLGGLLTIHNAGGFKTGQSLQTAAPTNKLISALKNKGAGVAAKLATVTSAAPTSKQELKTLLASKGERAKLQAANDEYNNWKPGAKPEDFDAHIKKVFGAEDGKDSAYAIALEGISIEAPLGGGQTQNKQLYSMQPKDLMAALIGTIAELQTAAATKPACPGHKQTTTESDALCSKIKDANECNSKHFCSYNGTETDSAKKCKYNATKASASDAPVTQAQTTSRSETPAEKCTGKKKDDCKDGCKWEAETCKDSSILLTKNFALSVVSAALVALLF
uniref:Variant surface glycoprotein AnTaT 1.1 n=1 Tax=Trypanosoma brucei brucei TaxID=5702 RepID=VSA1_TRYBB|nr:RecName: Full=Variant surface glycoprotein AnTaT 1.1; Short=VSG; AltName: Full=Expression-linked copy; Short=ELC; Flags: Precursor [Trypanosoma brucei brucei]CAA25971.1 AnTat 1.1 variant surface glycoprotein precursor [Trypanosoma brucei]